MLFGKKGIVEGLEKNVREVCSAGKSQWIFSKKWQKKEKKMESYSLLMKIIVELNCIKLRLVVIEIGFISLLWFNNCQCLLFFEIARN